MLEHLHAAVVLITTSKQQDKPRFGTGFVCHRDEGGVYILTCAHVVRDLGDTDYISVGDSPAEVIVMGEPDGFDIAMLKIKQPGFLNDIDPLIIGISRNKTGRVGIIGCGRNPPYKEKGEIYGSLENSTGIYDQIGITTIQAWNVRIDEKQSLKVGYSGSPVVDLESKMVIGLAIAREGESNGKIISVDAINRLRVNLPSWTNDVFRNIIDAPEIDLDKLQNQRVTGLLQQRRMQRQQGGFKRNYKNIRRSLDLVDFDLLEQMETIRTEFGYFNHGLHFLSLGEVRYDQSKECIVPRIIRTIRELTECNLESHDIWLNLNNIDSYSNINFFFDQLLNIGCAHSHDIFGIKRIEGFITIYGSSVPPSYLNPIADQLLSAMREHMASSLEQRQCLIVVLWVNFYKDPPSSFVRIPSLVNLPVSYVQNWLSNRLMSANVIPEDAEYCLKYLNKKLYETGGNIDVIYRTIERISLALEKGSIQCLV